jgi:hypothetical protein
LEGAVGGAEMEQAEDFGLREADVFRGAAVFIEDRVE